MNRLYRWIVPDDAFWDWRDIVRVNCEHIALGLIAIRWHVVKAQMALFKMAWALR